MKSGSALQNFTCSRARTNCSAPNPTNPAPVPASNTPSPNSNSPRAPGRRGSLGAGSLDAGVSRGGSAAIATCGIESPAIAPATKIVASMRGTAQWYRMRRMTRSRLRAVLLLALMSTACRTDRPAPRETVIVFAAASLSDAFHALERAYEEDNPQIDIVINFAGSQLLATQLIEGAPADVFASADAKNLDRVLAERKAIPNTRQAFASNTLMIAVPSDSKITNFDEVDELLANPDAKAVLAATEVPIGRYAREVLDELGLRESFEKRLVSNEESVDGVLAKLELGECDIGIVYATDLRRSGKLRGIQLPATVDVTAHYELAVLADGPTPDQGQEFVMFIVGSEGQEVLRTQGFGPP